MHFEVKEPSYLYFTMLRNTRKYFKLLAIKLLTLIHSNVSSILDVENFHTLEILFGASGTKHENTVNCFFLGELPTKDNKMAASCSRRGTLHQKPEYSSNESSERVGSR